MGIKRYFQVAPRTDLIGIGVFAVSAALAAWTPEDILARPWVKVYVDFMARLIPSVGGVPKFSPLPGVAQFYYAVMWLTVPLTFGSYIYIFVKAPPYRRNEVFRRAHGKIKWMAMVIFIPMVLYYAFNFLFLGEPPGSRLVRFQMSSRFGLGFVGTCEFIAMGMVAGFWVILILNWRRFLLQKTSEISEA